MPITDILLLAMFIAAFVGLAGVLAWGERQTRDIAKESRAHAVASAAPAMSDKTAESRLEEKKKPKTPVHA